MELAQIAELQREREHDGFTAAAGPPLVPPRPWFELDEPDEGPVAWTVTADGQVFGHAAVWGTCHTGKPGKCITPPKSRSDYAYYKTGLTEVDDGELIPTGRITLGTGHASLTASPAATAEHYDNTGAVVADVTVRDGKHGIWVTGALRPGVTPERARELRGASLSGDWRSIRGGLEMLGLLAVNVPGFPVPRAMAASGAEDEVLALVAAGIFADDVQILPETEDHELEAEFKALYASTMKRSDAFLSKKQKVKDALCATAASDGRPIVTSEVSEEFIDEAVLVEAHAFGEQEGLTAASPGRARARKIAQVMREFKAGTLKDGNGNKVTDRKQALAIAMSKSKELTAAAKDEEEEEEAEVVEDVVDEEEDEDDEEDEEEKVTASMLSGLLDVAEEQLLADEGCEECEAVEEFPGEQLLAASFTQGMRERLAKKGHAMSDGSFPIRNRGDLRNAIQAVGRASDPDAAKSWIIKRARALKAVGDLPASWNITASAELGDWQEAFSEEFSERELIAAGAHHNWRSGTFTEGLHPRHPKGTEKGGQFAPKGTSKLAPRPDEAGAAVENRRTMGGKLIKGPGGKLMSRTEAGLRLDQQEGRRPNPPVSAMSPSDAPPRTTASDYLNEVVDYGGVPTKVGDIYAELGEEKAGMWLAGYRRTHSGSSGFTFDGDFTAQDGTVTSNVKHDGENLGLVQAKPGGEYLAVVRGRKRGMGNTLKSIGSFRSREEAAQALLVHAKANDPARKARITESVQAREARYRRARS